MAQSGLSMSVNDVLQTDWAVLTAVLDNDQGKERVQDLFEFLKTID